MVLIPSHPTLADALAGESPLALLRRRRAEAEAELPRSVALSSLMFLTAVVLVMVGSLAFRGGPQTTVIKWTPPPGPRPHPAGNFDPTGGGVVRVVPPATVTGQIIPVKDPLLVQDTPIVSPTTRGIDPGPPGELDGPRVGAGGPGPVEPEAEPLPKDFIPTDEFPQVVSKVTPDYPGLARAAGAEGRVLVRLLIGVDGRVRRAEIEQSAPLFDDAAIVATRQWTFTPAKANGHPVMVWIRIPVQFSLR